MKQIEVQIMQQSYLLACPDGNEAHLRDAVARVDEAMCQIRDAGKTRARERIAVLAALNLAFAVADHENTPAAVLASDDPRLSRLLQRLDHALGEDGRLL